ncbi:MAG: cell wall-binding repeat-containing protein, partial [Coriobacteriales bacterium]
ESVDYDAIKSSLGDTYNYTQLSGNNRYETSVRVAEFELENGMSADNMVVASGTNFPDALTGSALCGQNGSVLVLENGSNKYPIDNFISANSDSVNSGYILGGSSAVSDEILVLCELAI